MSRAKLVCFCAVFMLLLFAFAFGAFAASDDDLNVSVSFYGAGVITVNGEEYDSGDYPHGLTVPVGFGDTVTLTASAFEDDEELEFLCWLNKETNRVVSWSSTYSFTAVTYSELEVVFDYNQAYIAAKEGSHTIIYLSAGENLRYLKKVMIGDESYYSAVPQHGLVVSGQTFAGWDHSVQQAAWQSGRVIVRPKYGDKVTYTITSVVGGSIVSQTAQYSSEVNIVAPETLNGETFSYWNAVSSDPNVPAQIASYYPSYSFICTMDARYEAVYGKGQMSGVALRVAGDVPNFEGATIKLHAEHSVTTDYTVIQHGMIVTEDPAVGNFEDVFVINENDKRIRKGTSNNTARAGTYSITISKWYAVDDNNGYYYPKKFVRAYVIARDRNGNIQTFYSTPIYCADYSSHVFEFDNFDDPF